MNIKDIQNKIKNKEIELHELQCECSSLEVDIEKLYDLILSKSYEVPK